MESKKEEHAAKEAFNATALAQLLFGPGGWEARAILLTLGVPGDGRDSAQGRMNSSDEAQTPIGSIQTDDARADLIQMYSPCQ